MLLTGREATIDGGGWTETAVTMTENTNERAKYGRVLGYIFVEIELISVVRITYESFI